ncbi:ATP-binding protein [Pseudonocardia hispaniensis]|uniref:ATP-binding protein n=1 Tax=Pseudonocardia hispaniensis TaxID=904933 RepID=A0ABW1IYS1_9PSEU
MDRDPALLGRDAELAALADLLGAHRAVTITGAGGVGKTRLALAVAGRTPQAAVCSLARHSRPDQVPAAIADSLGYPSWDAALVGLADRPALIVLDCCEHLLDAAADAVELLLVATRTASVLATSREPLAIPDEHVLWLDPLAVGDDPATSPAVALFLARAAAAGTAVEPDADTTSTVVELCRRLDGLPLAIELAAARTRTLTPAEILGHLDRRLDLLVGHRRAPTRHRSLEAVVDWSYERLDPATQRLFNRLGVAEGLFTAESALAVGGEPGEDLLAVIGHLDRLVARSLVRTERRAGRTWYRLLETIRAYARAKLVASGEFDVLTGRCIDHTVAQCRALRDRSLRSRPVELSDTAEALRPDVHDALRYVLDHDERPERAFGLYGVLWHSDVPHGRARMVAELGERLLARWPDPHEPGFAEVAAVAATAHVVADNGVRAIELSRQALDAPADPLTSVLAGRARCLAHLVAGDIEPALAVLDETGTRAREQDLRPWRIELESLRALALADPRRPGDRVRALAMATDIATSAHREAAATDSPELAVWCALVHGQLLALDDPDAAQQVFEEVVDRSSHRALGRGLGHRGLGAIALLAGRFGTAATQLRAALDEFVHVDEAHLRSTLRWTAALARSAGRDDDAARLRASAGEPSYADLGDLLGRSRLDRRLAGLPDAAPLPTLRDAIALAGEVLAAASAFGTGPPLTEPVFRHEGAVWTIAFDGTTVRLPDAKGLHDLAALLAKPGRDIHCMELIGGSVAESGTGPTLDTQARRAYESRIRELQAELTEAEAAHDRGTAERAGLELDLLVEHLAAATGLGGRTRRGGGSQERARSAVGWRIRAAIGRIGEAHPALGRHLREAVRTGVWCSYQPVDPLRWRS